MILSGGECEHLLWVTTSHYLNMTHPRCYSTSKLPLQLMWTPGDGETNGTAGGGGQKTSFSTFNWCEINFTVRKDLWWLEIRSFVLAEYILGVKVVLVGMLHENPSETVSVSVLDADQSDHILIKLTGVGEDDCQEIKSNRTNVLGQFRGRWWGLNGPNLRWQSP